MQTQPNPRDHTCPFSLLAPHYDDRSKTECSHRLTLTLRLCIKVESMSVVVRLMSDLSVITTFEQTIRRIAMGEWLIGQSALGGGPNWLVLATLVVVCFTLAWCAKS